jgi:signal transduction histidine kinase
MQEQTNILLVDDEARNLDALESILDDPSYRLLRADSADLALKLLLENDVAAIVLDIKMPGVNGLELAQLIKGTKKFRQIPIVFLTAYLVDDQDILTGYGAGAVDYLTKPVNPLILRHKVAVFADLFRKTRALAELNEKLEARVKERTAELERASRMKDEFLAVISHELRTPLNAILGWATLAHSDVHNPERVQRGLEIIERNVKTQARLITDLLDVSRMVSGKLRLNWTKFALSDVIVGAADVVRHAAEAKGIRLVLEVDPGIGVTVGDPGRLQQVVWNLLMNAIRHTPQGERVTVSARRDGSTNVVRVQDAGVGIPRQHLQHIFEPFRQVDSSTTRAHGGLGLGLALVRHLVEAHGGTVEAYSDGPGRGATFTVSLPVLGVHVGDLQPEAATAAPAGAKTDATSGSSQRRGELADVRLLVVEDDPDSLEVVRVVLEDVGARVTTATKAGDALEALEAQSFDAMISDIGMPDLDGYALMRRIRSSGQTLPAVALTAYARREDVEQAKEAGYQEHLAKPVDSWELIEAVKTLLPARSSGKHALESQELPAHEAHAARAESDANGTSRRSVR